MSGSRSQTPASASSGPSTEYTSTTLNGNAHSSSASPRRSGETDASATQHGSTRRSHRQRASAGGFLLDSLAAHSRSSPASRRYGSLKGKSIPGQERVITPQRHSAYGGTYTADSSPAANGSPSTEGDAQSTRDEPEPRARPHSHSPYMTQSRRNDTADLVQLALKLNQERQRHTSARFQAQGAANGLAGRVVSTGSAAPLAVGTTRDQPLQGGLGERELATGAVIANGLGTQQQDSVGNEGYTQPGGSASVTFLPSPQTLIRAERAKIALELKYHHRRVLQHLPRLPPPKEHRPETGTTAQSDGGSAPAAFGRAFNPLQYARNRRIRMQRRCALSAEKDGWGDLDRVKAWVEEVAAQRHVQISSIYDNYPLPYFGLDGSQLLESTGTIVEENDRSKQPTRLSLPPNDWTVAPPDLLADIYWLQEQDNRQLIEDHNGDKLYPPAAKSQMNTDGRRRSLFDLRTRSLSVPRKSTDSGRGSTSRQLSSPAAQRNPSPVKRIAGETAPVFTSVRGRKGSKAASPARWRSRTGSLSSSDDGKNDRHKFTRPWSRAFGKNWEGDTMPNKKSLDLPRHSKESQRPGRISLEVTPPQAGESQRPLSIELHPPEEDLKLLDRRPDALSDLDSTAPNSPVQEATVPSLAVDFDSEKIFGSPPSKRRPASKRGKEPADRHHEVELRDFADDPFQNYNSSRTIKGLTKANTSTLSSPSETSFSADSEGFSRPKLRRNETERLPLKSPVDGGAKFPRPWKAGKYVAGRVGDFLRRKDYASDTSETDEDARRNGLKLPLSRANTASTSGPGTLSRSSTLSAVGESPGYRAPEMPSFSPLRREGTTGSPSRIKTNDSISQRLASDVDNSKLLSPASINMKSPSRSLTPQLSRMATAEGKDSADSSRRASVQANGNGRRGATFTDTSGQQWPLPNRSNASAWPGETTDGTGSVWTGPELKPTKSDEVTESDIRRTEAILRSLCVKATKVAQTFQCPPAKSSPLLEEVRQEYNSEQSRVAKLDEPEVLAGHLMKKVDTHTGDLNHAAETFLTDSINGLERQLEDVKSIVHDKLTGMVLAAGDDADGLGHELSAGLTREVRDLNDSIDQILRARRRRNRVLRRILFGVLEWMITATMWAVWLLVVTFKMARGVLRFVVGVIRWLFLL